MNIIDGKLSYNSNLSATGVQYVKVSLVIILNEILEFIRKELA